MTKAVWRGYIALGSIGIPVRLYSASRSMRPRFVLLHESDGSPVERILICRKEQKEVPHSEVVRAVPSGQDQYVVLSNTDLERADSGEARIINIRQFASLDAVAPPYYERPFYVVPARGGERAYALLRETIAMLRVLAIATFVMRSRAYVAALQVEADMIMLLRLRYAAEIVSRDNIRSKPLPRPTPQELDALAAVIRRHEGPLYLQDFHDEHIERLNDVIEHKARGLPLPRPERILPHTTPPDELLSSLYAMAGKPLSLP